MDIYGNIKFKAYAMNWYYTAKDTLYGKQPDGNVVVASQTTKHGHAFSYTTPENLVKLIQTNRGLYEVLTDYPKKMYADIDFDNPADDFDQNAYLDNCVKQFQEFLPNIQFAISGSVCEKRASFHLVSTNYLIENSDQLDAAKTIAKAIFLQNDGIDWKVYTKNREMKCINQSKPKKPVQLPITHKDQPQAHLISCFMPKNYQSIPCVLDIKEEDPVTKLRQVKQVLCDDIPSLDLPNPTDITWEQLGQPEHAVDLLALIPLDPTFPHSHTHTVGNFCFNNKVPKAYFMKWLEKKGGDIQARKQKYGTYHWNKYGADKRFAVSQIAMRKRLLRWYPNLRPRERAFSNFQNQMNIPMTIADHLDAHTFQNCKTKFLTLNHPMGFGKTTALLDFLKDQFYSFVYVVPRITLAEDIYSRMKEMDIEVSLYKNIGRNKQEKAQLIADSWKNKNIIICLNSLHYLLNRDMLFQHVIFDECETAMSAFVGSGSDKYGNVFMNTEDKRNNLMALKSVIDYADKVIGLDAFTTKRWTNLCQSICPKSQHTILTASKPQTYTRKLIQLKGNKYENVLSQIANDIANNEKIFVFFPYKNGSKKVASMETIMETIAYLVRQKGIDFERNRDYQCYNADSDDKIKKEIGNVNEFWNEYKLVMCNNSITAGVSYIAQNQFSKVYLFVAPFNLPRDIAQVSMRCRQLVTNEIYIQFIQGLEPDAYPDDSKDVNISFYTSMLNDTITEFQSPQRLTCELFFSKANFDVSQSAQATKKSEEVADILEDIQQQISQLEYDQLDLLSDNMAQNMMKDHLQFQNAKTIERYALRKWMFNRLFNEDTPKLVLKNIWNNGLYTAVCETRKAKENDKSFENLLAKANGWDFFPEIDGSKRARDIKWDLPEEARTELFEQWKTRFDKNTKQIPDLLKAVYNTKYGIGVINSRQIKDGDKKKPNIYYDTLDEEYIRDQIMEYSKYLKSEVEDGNIE